MKRKITWLVCLVLAAALLAAPVLAASVSVSLSASATSVNSGDKVTITVSATVNSCGSGGVEISYDSKVFELVSGEWLLSGTFMTDFDTSSKDGVFVFEKDSAISGKAFKFVLKVKDSASLGSSNVTVKFTADGTSASKSVGITVACAHKYDNSCDTTCNLCGASRSISHTWDSGKVTKAATCTATGTKTYTCTVCGKTKTEEVKKAAHSYDNNCDADCNACGATRTITHSYEWVYDEADHWQKCTVCGDKLDSAAHTFSEEVSSNASGHGYACTVCGMLSAQEDHVFEHDCDTTCDVCAYERTVTHDYSSRWSSDESGHWHECSICGDRLETEAHTPGDEATETTDQICLDCGYILQVAGNHEHSMAGDWLSDDEGHWYLCVCREFTQPEAHDWSEGIIDETAATVTYVCTVCGHEKVEGYVPPTTEPETLPTESVAPTQPQEEPRQPSFLGAVLGDWFDSFPWWIVAAALLVLLIVSVCFNVYLLRCLFASKKTGKFARKEANTEQAAAAPVHTEPEISAEEDLPTDPENEVPAEELETEVPAEELETEVPAEEPEVPEAQPETEE